MERENEMIVISHRLFDWEKRFRVSPGGVLPLDCLQKRGGGFYRFRGLGGSGTAHFVILSGEKRRVLRKR